MECNQNSDNPMASYLEGDAILRCFNESSNNDPILEPKHKIFLSHSGAQKEFVEHLCKALEDRWYYPFFDRRPNSLPKGERFPELIIQAAQQCEMLIVVVSNEYFMSKWPMIELNAFVKAHQLNHKAKCVEGGPKILPLFYGLSPKELEDKAIQKNWFESWEHLAKFDPKKQISISDWKYALEVLRSFNGLEYNKQMGIVAYEDEIVSHVCKSIIPDLKWDDSHVQGKSKICKTIGEEIRSIKVSEEYHIKVVGIYGVGGIGKTTTCKTLSNELLREYEGRVCHLELPSVASKDSIKHLQRVLLDLTRRSKEVIQNLDEGMCNHALRTSVSQHKVFLAIDNVSDDYKSIKLAKMFLEVPYHEESLIIVTARSKSILERLGIDGDACIEMPELEEEDAMKLFLYHATHREEFFKDEDKDHIQKCIQRCYFSKGDGISSHYHPLALEALGLQLGYHGKSPLEWVKNLPRVKTFSSLSRTNPVFDILRSNFDLLPSSEQNLFMDVGLFSRLPNVSWITTSNMWLCYMYKEDEDEIQDRLENLKRKGLLQDVDWKIGEITMHDLYFEFVILEAKGSFNESRNLKKQKWMYVNNGDFTKLEKIPEGRCWPKLVRLAIHQIYLEEMKPKLSRNKKAKMVSQPIASLEGIQWDHFSNLELLYLKMLHCCQATLNLECLMGLRILHLFEVGELSSLKGLGKLKNLTLFHLDSNRSCHIIGQLPSSLRTLHIVGTNVVVGSDLLAQCHILSNLDLSGVEVSKLDLSNCWSLEKVNITCSQKLQTLSGLSICRPSTLQSLEIFMCKNLVDILGVDHLTGLKKLYLIDCPLLEVPNFTKFLDLELRLGSKGIQNLVVGAQNSILHQFQELYYSSSQSMVGLNLNGLNQLEVLDLDSSDGLVSLEGVWNLPALQYLNLSHCKNLLQLPDLNKSRNLKDLNLIGCYALKLHEKDIQMLSKLPLLQPAPFSKEGFSTKFRLDFVRRKILIHSCKKMFCNWVPDFGLHWKEYEWDEKDMDAPPLQIAKYGPI